MYCKNCHKSFNEDERYCPECGSRLTTYSRQRKRKQESSGKYFLIGVIIAIAIIIIFLISSIVSNNIYNSQSSSNEHSEEISDNVNDTQLTIGKDLSTSEYMDASTSANYTEIVRNPQNFTNKILRFTGSVENINETDYTLSFKLNVTNTNGSWRNGIYVEYEKIYSNEDPITDGDIVSVYGQIFNNCEYDGELIPYMIAKYTMLAGSENLYLSSNEPSDNSQNSDENAEIADNNTYLFPSHREIITEEYLNTLSEAEIALIRNEIYARHGYEFSNESFATYFSGKSWYEPNPNFSEDLLNDIEMKNKSIIVEYEKAQGWR